MIREPILDVELIKSACADGNIDAVAELSSILGSNLNQRILATERGAYHLASSGEYLPDSLIGNFAYRIIAFPPEPTLESIQLPAASSLFGVAKDGERAASYSRPTQQSKTILNPGEKGGRRKYPWKIQPSRWSAPGWDE